MFFKNLYLLTLDQGFTMSPEALDDAMQVHEFKPCATLQAFSFGWVSPIGKEDAPLVHAANGCLMVCAQREEKILPSQVVAETLAEKIAEIEEREGMPVRKAQRDTLREEIIHDLLPRAFSFTRRLYAYIDLATGWLVVDSASAARAEELASLLRQSLGSLPAAPPSTQLPPAQVMTRWLHTKDLPAGIGVRADCSLKAEDESGEEIIFRHADLSQDELQAHLDAGLAVKQLALSWRDRLSFTLDSQLRVKRLRFLDLVQEERMGIETDSPEASFDADFAIMSGELREFIPALVKLFGGLAD